MGRIFKATLTHEYTVGRTPGDILALPNGVAIILSGRHRYVYVLEGGQSHEVPLSDPGAPEHSLDVENHIFHQGALFAYGQGFGAIYADTVYLWKTPTPGPPTSTRRMERPTLPPLKRASLWTTRKGETLWIEQPRRPHYLAPLAASAAPGEPRIVALLNAEGALYAGRYLAWLRLTETTATWEDYPHQLSFDDFATVARPQYEYSRDEHLYPAIIDVLALSATSVRVHSVGKPRRYAVYGMDFSALAEVDDRWTSRPVATLDRGFGRFSADRRWLLLQGLRGKPRLSIYTADGQSRRRNLLDDNILGHVREHFYEWTCWGETLWLTDTDGAVACSTITAR